MLMLRSVLFLILMYLGMAVYGLLGLPFALWSVDGTYKVMQAYVRYVFWLLRVLCGVTTEIRGEAPKGEALVAAKHQSFLDVMLLFSAVDRAKFIMKKELKWAPIFGFYAQRIGSISVDRGKRGATVKQMIATAEGAEDRGQTLIYPQGTRVAPGATAPYKIGAGVLYDRMGLGCIPVATNAGVFWGRKTILRYPGKAVIEFLPPIAPGLDVNEAVAEMERRIEPASDALLHEAQRFQQ